MELMKKLLAVGDSLLAGQYGESPLNHSEKIKQFRLINRGQNGMPMSGILRNLEVHLRTNLPEILLLDGGANDLLIPYMEENHPEQWGPFIRNMERHKILAAQSLQEFGDLLKKAVALSRGAGVREIILLTIPLLSENLEHPLHKKKIEINSLIRQIQKEESLLSPVHLADLGERFNSELEPIQPGSTWLFQSPMDLENDRNKEPSRERGLVYTIDGVHLNSRGALICGEILDGILTGIDC